MPGCPSCTDVRCGAARRPSGPPAPAMRMSSCSTTERTKASGIHYLTGGWRRSAVRRKVTAFPSSKSRRLSLSQSGSKSIPIQRSCWRIGPGAVAIFGKDLSQTQKLLLVHHFAGRPIVVMLDPDAHEQSLGIQQTLFLARGGTEGSGPVVVTSLPDAREDPAACTRQRVLSRLVSQDLFDIQEAHARC